VDRISPGVAEIEEFVVTVTEDCLVARREIDGITGQIPVPDAIVCSPDDKLISFFAFAQGSGNSVAACDVNERAFRIFCLGDGLDKGTDPLSFVVS